MEMRRFEGKTAVITGAAQGMGEVIARRFAKEGGRALIIDIEVDKLEAVAKSIGDAVVPMEVDVRRSESGSHGRKGKRAVRKSGRSV